MLSSRAPSARIALDAARASASLLLPALRELWPTLLLMHALDLGFSQIMSILQDRALASGSENLFAIATLVAWQILFSLLWSCAYLAIVGRGLVEIAEARPRTDWFWRLKHAWNQTLIETLRAWALLLRWGILFVFPAAIAYGRLFWVPFVAALDAEYDAGKVDALEKSRALSKGRWGLTIAIALAAAIVPLGLSYLAQGSDDRLLSNPLRVIAGAAIEGAASLALFLWAFCAFRGLAEKPLAPPRAHPLQTGIAAEG
jgi:hypothetical protein